MSGDQDVVQRLKEAAAAVSAAELPPELCSAGLVLAFWAGAPNGTPHSAPQKAGTPTGLAGQLGVDSAILERIYDIDGDQIVLTVPRRALGKSKSAAMTEVAHLIVAARQSLGHGDWTSAVTIRNVCEEMGVCDGNFGRSLQQLHGVGFRTRGAGAQREVKMNAAGFEETASLIERIATNTV